MRCVFPVPEGLSQREAQKQQLTQMTGVHEKSRRVLELLSSSPYGASLDILQKLRQARNLDEAIEDIADASLLLPNAKGDWFDGKACPATASAASPDKRPRARSRTNCVATAAEKKTPGDSRVQCMPHKKSQGEQHPSHCDGIRPCCHACSVSKTACVYSAPEGLTVRLAERDELSRVSKAYESSRQVLKLLCESADDATWEILQRLKDSEHFDDTIQSIADAALLLPLNGNDGEHCSYAAHILLPQITEPAIRDVFAKACRVLHEMGG
ncbi:hypothetical protein CGLO_11141 [Colletotrichum gloeosporioides Cg-14]|uniref:Uncharacterized protein n=1 Tax=Colletotrichum gloeosporioides (strain Cg-14) TaxID=1237896 RepID=T0LCT2_COLGC|nr:hypothetical protein CGLO_11141 [Colletotrichum gloeosporioides Cg-14]